MKREAVFREILKVRDLYRTDTTREQWGAMIKGLGHILANEELGEHERTIVEGTLFETCWRSALVQVMPPKEEAPDGDCLTLPDGDCIAENCKLHGSISERWPK
jgi:hypothetical protein